MIHDVLDHCNASGSESKCVVVHLQLKRPAVVQVLTELSTCISDERRLSAADIQILSSLLPDASECKLISEFLATGRSMDIVKSEVTTAARGHDIVQSVVRRV